MRRAAAWMIFLLLLLGAFLAAWFLPTGQPAAPVAPPPAAPAKAPAPAVVPAAPAEPAAPAAPDEAPPAAGPRLERWLEGTVKFEDGAPVEGARIVASASERGGQVLFDEVVTGPDGAFRLDLTPRSGKLEYLRWIEVLADHASALPRTERVNAPASARDYDRPLVVIPLDLTLPRAAAAEGRVVDAHGVPLRGAEVLSFVPRGACNSVLLDRTLAAGEGEFRLRVPAAGLCVVFAHHPGKRAAFRDWSGGGGPATDLVLEDAVSIAGRVTDAAGNPIADAAVQAQRLGIDGEAQSLFLMKSPIAIQTVDGSWIGGGVATAESDVDGSFTLSGLDPGPYRVQVVGLAGRKVLEDALDDAACDARAPSTGVALRLDFVRVRLEVRLDGEAPPAEARCGVAFRRHHVVRLGADLGPDGVVEILARPGAKYSVSLGNLPQRVEDLAIEVPAGGRNASIRVDFSRAEPRASLLVLAAGPSGVPARAGFGFFDPEKPDSKVPEFHRNADAADGGFLVRELPPGRWRVVVRAGGPWLGGDAHFLEESVDVELPPRGRAEARVALRTGGRIRIDARDREGQPVDADCEILDGVGRAVPASFQVKFESGGAVAKTGGLVPRGENLVVPALPEGTYTLCFSGEGWKERTETVPVRAGETARVSVVLERSN